MFGINDEHDCNVVSMNSLNIHDANDMQSYRLGDAMFEEHDVFQNIFAAINVYPKLRDATFNEYDICSLPSFVMQIYNDDSMPPTYDDCIDESGFGEVMTLFSNDSTIFEEVSIDYENKVAIYDVYGVDMYAIKNNDNHETFHHDFNVQFDYVNHVPHDSYFVELAPTIMNEKKFAYVESNRFSMLLCHEKNDICDPYGEAQLGWQHKI